jgi:hypothetical protein
MNAEASVHTIEGQRVRVPPSDWPPLPSAFVKDVLEAAFQVHPALLQKSLARLALNGTSSAMKSFSYQPPIKPVPARNGTYTPSPRRRVPRHRTDPLGPLGQVARAVLTCFKFRLVSSPL